MFNGTYVRMLGNNQPPVCRALPRVLADLLSNRTKPKFSGLATDWGEFAKEWGRYQDMLVQVSGGPVSEAILLDLLTESLDRASKLRLEEARDNNKHLSYTNFWKRLQKEFDRLMSADHRAE